MDPVRQGRLPRVDRLDDLHQGVLDDKSNLENQKRCVEREYIYGRKTSACSSPSPDIANVAGRVRYRSPVPVDFVSSLAFVPRGEPQLGVGRGRELYAQK